MSVYTMCKTQIKRLSSLQKALIAMGVIDVHIEIAEGNTLKLKGYYGNEQDLVQLMVKGKKSNGSNSHYDFGWSKEADATYTMHLSDMDKSTYGKNWQNKLIDQYAKITVEEICEENQWVVQEESVQTDGSLQLVVQTLY